jgi:hypothetical protein
MQEWQRTVASQYSNSPSLNLLIDSFNQCVDPTVNIETFYDMVFNVDTAQGYGLDVWGRIVGVSRYLNIASGKFFGFEEATNISADPFNVSPFYTGGPLTGNFALSDSAYRVLIFAKALANITNCSIPSLNQLLINLFPGRGNAYVDEPSAMHMRYVFRFVLTPVEDAIVNQSGILPHPAGVAVTSVYIP